MNKLTLQILTMLFITLTWSCKSTKSTTQPVAPKAELSAEEKLRLDVISKLNFGDFDFQYLSMKSKAQVKSGEKSFNLTINFRMKWNDKIWASVNALGGFEVSRFLLTKDSIYVIDRINKEYYVRGYDYLAEVLKADVDFFALQALLVGNVPMKFNMSKARLSQSVDQYSLVSEQSTSKLTYILRKDDLKLQAFQYIAMAGIEVKSLDIAYMNFKLVEIENFPQTMVIVANSSKERTKIDVQHSKIEKVEKLDFPFNVPKRFE